MSHQPLTEQNYNTCRVIKKPKNGKVQSLQHHGQVH